MKIRRVAVPPRLSGQHVLLASTRAEEPRRFRAAVSLPHAFADGSLSFVYRNCRTEIRAAPVEPPCVTEALAAVRIPSYRGAATPVVDAGRLLGNRGGPASLPSSAPDASARAAAQQIVAQVPWRACSDVRALKSIASLFLSRTGSGNEVAAAAVLIQCLTPRCSFQARASDAGGTGAAGAPESARGSRRSASDAAGAASLAAAAVRGGGGIAAPLSATARVLSRHSSGNGSGDATGVTGANGHRVRAGTGADSAAAALLPPAGVPPPTGRSSVPGGARGGGPPVPLRGRSAQGELFAASGDGKARAGASSTLMSATGGFPVGGALNVGRANRQALAASAGSRKPPPSK